MKSEGLVESIRQRLLNLSRERGVVFDTLLVQYGLERLLFRLQASGEAGAFVLKGAMLYHVWGGDTRRPTRDLDLLGRGTPEPERVARVFRRIIAADVPDDGLTFGEPVAEPIREDASYGGIRVKMTARLGNIRIPIQVDVGFGDAVDPAPQEREFPVLLSTLPAPVIRVYPPETVVAEKLEALVVLDLQNSRMKDFFDLHYLLSGDRLDRALLERSIRGTFERRKTPFPSECPSGLTDEFGRLKQPMWKAFLNRNGLKAVSGNFIEVVSTIRKNLPFGWSD
jgi:predicted nucleotidyltransferase component of viral defense system